MTVHGMHREASIEINASPEAVYDLISALQRMGSGALRTSVVSGSMVAAVKWATASSATIGLASAHGRCR